MERTDDVKAVIYDNKHTSSQLPDINKDVTQTPNKMSSPSDEAWGPLFESKEAFVEKHLCWEKSSLQFGNDIYNKKLVVDGFSIPGNLSFSHSYYDRKDFVNT